MHICFSGKLVNLFKQENMMAAEVFLRLRITKIVSMKPVCEALKQQILTVLGLSVHIIWAALSHKIRKL